MRNHPREQKSLHTGRKGIYDGQTTTFDSRSCSHISMKFHLVLLFRLAVYSGLLGLVIIHSPFASSRFHQREKGSTSRYRKVLYVQGCSFERCITPAVAQGAFNMYMLIVYTDSIDVEGLWPEQTVSYGL